MSNGLYKGTLSNLIFKLLSENEKMYGYELTKKITEQTNNGFQLTEGALYTTLHKLEAKNLLEVEFKKINGRTRKYYKLSNNGKKIAPKKIKELKTFIENLSGFLSPKSI